MNQLIRVFAGYLAAVLATYVLGAIFVSQGNLACLIDLGMQVEWSHRFDAMFHDVTSMPGIYLPLIAIALLIAFPVAASVIHFLPNLRLVGYLSAGFVALIAMHIILKATLGLSGIAATRTTVGLLAQGVAGALGGYLFHLVTIRRAAERPAT